MNLAFSDLESQRFDMRVFRAVANEIDDRQLFRSMIEQRIDLLILRMPAPAGKHIAALQRYGLSPLHADTLVYYYVDLSTYEPQTLRNKEVVFDVAREEDFSTLQNLVGTIFVDYQTNYHANSLLDPSAILAGYKEWVCRHVTVTGHDRITWIVRKADRVLGFCSCSFDEPSGEAEGVLYGLLPDAAGGGLYGDMIRYTQAHFKKLGVRSMKVSTQAHNYAVQKVWCREGFVLKQALDTFHISALFGRTCLPPVRERFVVDPSDVERFAALSGDLNPVHFDDDMARAAGFTGRITHGMLFANWLSRHFGTQTPGPGTLFLNNTIVFMKPVYPQREYNIALRFPVVRSNGYHKAVAELTDPDGILCAWSHSDLMKRQCKD